MAGAWGVLAFALNYLPYIGSLTVTALLPLFAFVHLEPAFSGSALSISPPVDLFSIVADSDEAGHAFQSEAGHLFRSEAGRRSDLMSATGGLLPRIEVDDVSGDRIGQERIDFTMTNAACAGFRR